MTSMPSFLRRFAVFYHVFTNYLSGTADVAKAEVMICVEGTKTFFCCVRCHSFQLSPFDCSVTIRPYMRANWVEISRFPSGFLHRISTIRALRADSSSAADFRSKADHHAALELVRNSTVRCASGCTGRRNRK